MGLFYFICCSIDNLLDDLGIEGKMKVYVSYKSYLWNFKGYEPPIATNLSSCYIEVEKNVINESSIEEIKLIIEKGECERYKKITPVGSTEVIILGITKLDKKEE